MIIKYTVGAHISRGVLKRFLVMSTPACVHLCAFVYSHVLSFLLPVGLVCGGDLDVAPELSVTWILLMALSMSGHSALSRYNEGVPYDSWKWEGLEPGSDLAVLDFALFAWAKVIPGWHFASVVGGNLLGCLYVDSCPWSSRTSVDPKGFNGVTFRFQNSSFTNQLE